MNYPQNDNRNWKMGFGLLAGALLGYWLNSEQGRRVRSELQTNATQYGEQASSYVKNQADNLAQTANQYYEQGVNVVNDAAVSAKQAFKNNVDTVANETEDTIGVAENKIKRGINTARRNIKNAADSAV